MGVAPRRFVACFMSKRTHDPALRDVVVRETESTGTDPAAAAEAWSALVDGRWRLIDRFERNGRCYWVALRIEPPLPLTHRERDVVELAALGKPNKLIGYELGISESGVATHLSAASRKLAAESRVDLIRLVLALRRGSS